MKMPFPLPAKHSNWHLGKKCELIDSQHAISGHVITGRRGLTKTRFRRDHIFNLKFPAVFLRLSVGFVAELSQRCMFVLVIMVIRRGDFFGACKIGMKT